MDNIRHTKSFREIALTGAQPTDWLIEGIYPLGDTVLISAPSHSGKTYLVIDQAMAVAYGEPWLGKYPTKHGPVLYIPSEGHRTIGRRMMAAAEYRYGHLDVLPQVRVFDPPGGRLQLHPIKDTPTMISLAETMDDMQPVFVIVDVLRDAAAGIPENTDEFGDTFGRLRNMAHEYGATVLVVHHTGKDDSKGARGHSSLKDKADIEAVLRSAPLMHDPVKGIPTLTSLTMDTSAPAGKNRNEEPYRLTVHIGNPDGLREAIVIGEADGPTQPNLAGLSVAEKIATAEGQPNLNPTSDGYTVKQLAQANGVGDEAIRKAIKDKKAQAGGLFEVTQEGRAYFVKLTDRGRDEITSRNSTSNPTSEVEQSPNSTNPQQSTTAEGLGCGPLQEIASQITEAQTMAVEAAGTLDWDQLLRRFYEETKDYDWSHLPAGDAE